MACGHTPVTLNMTMSHPISSCRPARYTGIPSEEPLGLSNENLVISFACKISINLALGIIHKTQLINLFSSTTQGTLYV